MYLDVKNDIETINFETTQLIKCGHNIILETEIIKEIAVCKRLIGELLTVIHVDNLNIVDDYLDRMKHEYRNLKEAQETIKKVGTDREYKPYTVTVLKHLEEIKNRMIELNKEVQNYCD